LIKLVPVITARCALLLSLLQSVSCASPRQAIPPPSKPLTAPPPLPAASAEPTATPDAPFRAGPPAAAGTIAWVPPRIESWSMPNGVRVLFVERRDLPIVGVRIVSSVGAGDLQGARPGTVAFMGAMLEQGAGKRGALDISNHYEDLGAEHGASCDWDACVVRAKVLASRLGAALDLIADIVLRPTLPESEIARTRKRWLASLQQEKSSPQAMEQNAIAATLYGRAHPYGHSVRGAPADITELKRDDIDRARQRVFQPRSTTIVVAGDVDSALLRSVLEARFAAWRGSASQRAAVPPVPRVKGPALPVILVDVPGAAQSQVHVAEEGAPFGSPDRIALSVMNAIFGGMFSSRINLDLREAHAYTYGARSRFAMRHGAGPFTAGAAVFTEHTGDAVRILLAHVVRIRDELVTAEELSNAKENAKLALPARFEGVEDIAGALQDIAVYDLPLNEYAVRAGLIDAVTAEDVQRVAKKWLRRDELRIVVTGDRAKVEKDLSSIGSIELYDAYGDPVK
jgi:zinc protease